MGGTFNFMNFYKRERYAGNNLFTGEHIRCLELSSFLKEKKVTNKNGNQVPNKGAVF